MTYEYEKHVAAMRLLEDLDQLEEWLYRKRRAIIADLVALERERDARAMERRRQRRHYVSRVSYARDLRLTA